MKLSEIKKTVKLSPKSKDGKTSVTTHLFFDYINTMEEDIAVSVEYELEAASHSDHPYGEGTAREEHSAELVISSIKLTDDEELSNDDGDPSGRTLKADTELMSQSWYKAWEKKHGAEFDELVLRKVE